MRIVTIPGIGSSDQLHWQSLWEQELGACRFAPASWDAPEAADWRAALRRELTEPTVLVAHSLGCLTAADVIAEGNDAVMAALMVAVPDQDGPAFPGAAKGFHTPRLRLGVPTVVVASADDRYASVQFARDLAAVWGSRLVEAGAKGHLNSASGLGAWVEGRRLLDQLLAEAQRVRPSA